jgi:hypothetical protein
MKLTGFLLLLALAWQSPAPACAQRSKRAPLPPPANAPVQVARTELPLEPGDSEVHVQPLAADSSVVLLLGRSKSFTNKTIFTFQCYDQELRLRHELPVGAPDEFGFTRMCAEGSIVYALFSSRATPGRLWVAAYSSRTGELHTQQFETKLSRDVLELKALDGRLFATVLLSDQQHVTALLLDVGAGVMQYLPAVYEPLPTQLTFVANAATRRAQYVLSQTNGRKSRLLLKELSDRGQLVSSEFVQAESERSLITAQLSPLGDTTTRLLMGTYSLRDPNYAQGLFATDLSTPPGTKPALRFYDFLRLKHFFDYLKPARLARLKLRTERRVARQVGPLRWHYRLLLHELQPQPDGGYVLVAEVYYPHYRYTNYGGGYLGPSMPSTLVYGNNRVFDGYQTTHVLACGFDRQGALLWDNIFVVENLRRFELDENVRQQFLPDGRLVLAYLDGEKLRYKIINRAEAGPNDHYVPIRTAGPDKVEKITETQRADLQPWFGSRFVATGYQTVRSEHGHSRQVFFLNSVVF